MSLGINIKVVGDKEVLKALHRFEGDVRQKLRGLALELGAKGEQDIKLSMKEGGNLGRIGPRGGRIRIHSKPGEAPYVQTGNLRASIGYKPSSMPGIEAVELGAIRRGKGGKEVPYGRKLEEEMNRPYLMPAVKRLFDSMPSAIRRLLTVMRQ